MGVQELHLDTDSDPVGIDEATILDEALKVNTTLARLDSAAIVCGARARHIGTVHIDRVQHYSDIPKLCHRTFDPP
jgi:hypothetical protein